MKRQIMLADLCRSWLIVLSFGLLSNQALASCSGDPAPPGPGFSSYECPMHCELSFADGNKAGFWEWTHDDSSPKIWNYLTLKINTTRTENYHSLTVPATTSELCSGGSIDYYSGPYDYTSTQDYDMTSISQVNTGTWGIDSSFSGGNTSEIKIHDYRLVWATCAGAPGFYKSSNYYSSEIWSDTLTSSAYTSILTTHIENFYIYDDDGNQNYTAVSDSSTTTNKPPYVDELGGDCTFTHESLTIVEDPPPPGGSGKTTKVVSDEWTTIPLLALKTQQTLQSLGYQTGVLNNGGVAYMEVGITETNMTLCKDLIHLSYVPDSGKTYVRKINFITIWVDQNFNVTAGSTTLAGSPFVGDGLTHNEDHELLPVVDGEHLAFKLDGKDEVSTACIYATYVIPVSAQIEEVGTSSCPGGCPQAAASLGSGDFAFASSPAGQTPTLTMSLGQAQNGNPVGQLSVQAISPNQRLYTASSLKLTAADWYSTVITNSDGTLRQVGTPQGLADIAPTSPGTGFQVTFYPTNAYIPGYSGGPMPTAGLTPVATWVLENPDSGATNRLRVREIRDGTTITNILAFNSGVIQLDSGNELRREILSESWDTNAAIRTLTLQTIDPASGRIVAQKAEDFGWAIYTKDRGMITANTTGLLARRTGMGADMRTTTFRYNPNGQLSQVTDERGLTTSYYYDDSSRMDYVERTYPAGNTYYYYTDYVNLTSFGDDPTLWPLTPRYTEFHQPDHIEYEYFIAKPDTTIRIRSTGNGWANPFGSGYLATTNRYYPSGGANAGWLKSVGRPDGTVELYTYGQGPLLFTNIVDSGQPMTNLSAITRGTRTVTILGTVGEILLKQVYDIAPEHPNGILTDQDTYFYTDDRKRSYQVTHLDGTTQLVQYSCCNLELTTDRDGTITEYYYDPLKRQTATLKNNILQTNILDVAGNVLISMRVGSDGSAAINRQMGYDTGGRLIFETNAFGGVTSYAYGLDTVNGGTINTTIYPDGGTRIDSLYPFGRTRSTTGTAVNPSSWDISGSGRITETKLDKDGNPTAEQAVTLLDAFGRSYQTTSGGVTSQSFFDQQGRLWKQINPPTTTLYQYNGLGGIDYTAIDMDADNTIDFAGTDRITRSLNDVTNDNNTVVRRTRIYAWGTNNQDSALLVSTSEASVDGLRTWNITWNGGVGVTNYTVTAYSTDGYRYVTNVAPDNSLTISVYLGGLLQSVTRKDGSNNQIALATYGYDAHGRQSAVMDARNGTTTTTYTSGDQVYASTSPAPAPGQAAQTTTYFYNQMGQLWKTVMPDSACVTNIYTPKGELQMTFGSRTYPVGYSYDPQGRMATMTNWQTFATGTGVEVTSWFYNDNGQLDHKQYNDGSTINYQYNNNGQLSTRSSARGTNTSYTYNKAGELETVTYSDTTTPGVTKTYDRRGRLNTVTWKDITANLTYNDAGQAIGESYSGGILGGVNITNGYDGFLRRTNLFANTLPVLLTSYFYDSASRLQMVSNSARSALYSYVANSPLVNTITYAQNGTARMIATKQWDKMNRLTNIVYTTNSVAVSKTAYQYNLANQRTAATQADSSYWLYQYDSLGQVTSGRKYWSDGMPVAGQQFDYSFDDIGNRVSVWEGGNEIGQGQRRADYTRNLLNQYTQRTVPGMIDMLGAANSNASVVVNGVTSSRRGEYYRAQVSVTNTSAAVWAGLTNVGYLNNGNNADYAVTNIGNVFVPKTPETFTYDADGNLTSDGRWTNVWDAENRLIAITNRSSVGPALCVKFEYDWQGRRIHKQVYPNNTGTGSPSLDQRYIYDGWNLIAVLSSSAGVTATNAFIWGSDLSGALQGAGGVRGLLWSDEISANQIINSHFACFDGNGNVTALINSTNAACSALYEYAPFGKVIRATGPLAKANPFRFSTKFTDDESDLVYYGYRYYNPSTGRWISRDPIAEDGGKNIYEFVGNDEVDFIDAKGLFHGEHSEITISAFNQAVAHLELSLTAACWGKVLRILASANVGQDTYNLKDNRRHYNRDPKSHETVADRQAADLAYRNYVDSEVVTFNWALRRNDCDDALEALGRMSHSWQDFYAHAIRRDGLGGNEASSFPGWDAWSEGVTGDPDNRGNFWPSSYSFFGGGEHPTWTEPLIYGSTEYRFRVYLALLYTQAQFEHYFYQWWANSTCRCNCK